MKNKNGQMEILGLAVIIILITLAGLFVVRFVILKPAEISKDYTMKSLAVDTITAMLRTNTLCHGESIKDLLMDCAEGPNILTCPGSKKSCEYVNETIEDILTKTLNIWNKNYIFNASQAGIYFENGNCTKVLMKPGGKKESAVQPLPTHPPMEVRLDVCE